MPSLFTQEISEEEVIIEPQQISEFSFTIRKKQPFYFLIMLARIDTSIPAGANNTLQLKINGKIPTGNSLINKPLSFSSKRKPTQSPSFLKEGFVIVMSPDFNALPGDHLYRPVEFTDEQLFKYVFDVSGLINTGNNTVIIKNLSAPHAKYTMNLVIADLELNGTGTEYERPENVRSGGIRVLTEAPEKSSFTMPFSTEKQNTSFIDDYIQQAKNEKHGYAWLTDFKIRVLEGCRYWMEKNPDYLWYSVPSQNVPRSLWVNRLAGSPVSGTEINKNGGYYQWLYDPAANPWKLKDVVTGDLFPKNDFFAYYVSGFDEKGGFDPSRADKTLLYNTEAKDWRDPKFLFGTDDGTGFSFKGQKYNFIGFYNMHAVWGGPVGFPDRPYAITVGPQYLAYAYQFTGDIRFARAALILIDRIADVYPKLDMGYWVKTGGGYHQFGYVIGKDQDFIWSAITVSRLARAYAMVRNALDTDIETIKFLSEKASKYKLLNKKNSPQAVKEHIDLEFIKEAFSAITNRVIHGNMGHCEEAAFFLDQAASDAKLSDEINAWLFSPDPVGYPSPAPLGKPRDGGGIAELIINEITTDGFSREGGAGYTSILPKAMMKIYDILGENAPVMNDPRFKEVFQILRQKLINFYRNSVHHTCIDQFIPWFGDGGNFASPGSHPGAAPGDLLQAFLVFNDPVIGKMYLMRNGITDEASLKTLFRSNQFISSRQDPGRMTDISTVTNLESRFRALLREAPFAYTTAVMPNRGYIFLKTGAHTAKRALVMNFGANNGHNDAGTLGLDLFAFGLSITPYFGYPNIPETVIRQEWWANTLSKWTVAFADRNAQHVKLFKPLLISESPLASVMSVDGKNAYPDLKRYDRTSALINAGNEQFYIVDFFRVDGAQEAMYCFHSSVGSVTPEGLRMRPQSSGTLAGENVPYQKPGHNGLSHVYDIERASCKDNAALLWQLKDIRNTSPFGDTVRTRFRIFHPEFETAIGKGKTVSTQKDPPDFNYYAFAISKMRSPLFTAVVECFEDGKNPVKSVKELRRISGSKYAGALEIMLTDGSKDIIMCTGSKDDTAVFEGGYEITGHFALIRIGSGGKFSLHASGVSEVTFSGRTEKFRLSGTSKVSDFDTHLSDEVTVKLTQPLVIPQNVLQPLYAHFSPVSSALVNGWYALAPHSAGSVQELNLGDAILASGIEKQEKGKTTLSYAFKKDAGVELIYSYYTTGALQ